MSFQIPLSTCSHALRNQSRTTFLIALLSLSAASLAAATEVRVELSGAQEVPVVETQAKGKATLKVDADGTIRGVVTTSNVDGTMAHIHQAPAGQNGGVVVPLQKAEDGDWTVPDNAQLNAEQMQQLQAGNLYINVHSAAHPGGEIRGQIEP
ncbi:MAG TPA: CHRD domain-containing protein [Spongiibacteraceae bacterium]|nr:CHRD domain-containing protein [Spongiibacteraceae bacterium]